MRTYPARVTWPNVFPFLFLFPHRIASMADEFQCSQTSRKILFYLIATLNASFNPDYDFSHCRGDEFSKEPSIKVGLFSFFLFAFFLFLLFRSHTTCNFFPLTSGDSGASPDGRCLISTVVHVDHLNVPNWRFRLAPNYTWLPPQCGGRSPAMQWLWEWERESESPHSNSSPFLSIVTMTISIIAMAIVIIIHNIWTIIESHVTLSSLRPLFLLCVSVCMCRY